MNSHNIIFFTVDITTVGGIERVTLNLANELVAEGWNVRIVSSFKTNDSPVFPFDSKIQFDFLSEKKYIGTPGSFNRLRIIIKNVRLVKHYFRAVQNSIIIAQSFPMAFLLSWSNVFKYNIVFAAEHVCYSYYTKLIRAIRILIYKKFHRVIVLTDSDKAYFDSHKLKCAKIPNGVQLNNNSIKLKKKRNIVSAVGRLTRQKNFSVLISVFSKIHRSYPDWILNIWGDGEEYDYLQSCIDVLQLNDCVFLKGMTNDVYKALDDSSIFVCSSIYEGFAIVLVEAMSCANACVSFDCPFGPAEIISDGKDGLLVKNQDQDQLQEKIETLIRDRSLRENLIKNALVSCRRFDRKAVVRQWLSLFSEF